MCKFNRILLGAGALLFSAVTLSISNFTLILYDNMNSTLSECNHLWEIILTNLIVLITSIVPLSIIFTPCKLNVKQQLYLLSPIACIMFIFCNVAIYNN